MDLSNKVDQINRIKEEKEANQERIQTGVNQGLSEYNQGQSKPLTLAGTPEEQAKALQGLNLAQILYGQNIQQTGKDVQKLRNLFMQRMAGTDPVSAAVMAQKQGALAGARGQMAQQGIKGGAALKAQDAVARQQNAQIQSSLYGQQGQAAQALRGMTGGAISGAAGLMFGSQAQGTEVPKMEAPSSGGLGTVLCTELYEQGILDKTTYLKDSAYGRQVLMTSPEVIIGYHFWAKPIVKLMKKSKLFTHIVKYPVLAWANHIANNKKSLFGHFCVKVGQPICGFIGKLIMERHNNVRQTY